VDATGQYTLSVRATDDIGNQTAAADYLQAHSASTRRHRSPTCFTGLSTTTITQTLALSGVITDPGTLLPACRGWRSTLCPPARSEYGNAATLAQSGVVTSNWTYNVPAGLEGNYLINWRARRPGQPNDDQLTWSGWQEIDTLALRAVVTMI
jgi:hypothetical protein